MVHPHVHLKKTRAKVGKRRSQQRRSLVWFDKLVVCMGVFNLVATLPQVIAVWGGQDASGVSTLSWGYYSLFSLVFLLYGVLHQEKPIIVSYIGSTVLFSSIFVGSIVY